MLFAEFSAIILMMILAVLTLMFAFGVLLLGWFVDVIISLVNNLRGNEGYERNEKDESN